MNPLLESVEPPPVAVVQSWTAGRIFPSDRPLLDLGQAAPGWPMAEALRTHVAEQLAKPGNSGYAPILGHPALRAALSDETQRIYGGNIASDQVAITSGCNQAFLVAAMAVAQAGEAIMLPVPWYFNHKMTLDMLGIETQALPCRTEDSMVPDMEAAARAITLRTRAIVLVTPNNPTGAIYPAATLAAFRDLAARHGLALIIDETYRDFIPEAAAPHALFEEMDWPETVVQIYSFSKSFAMPGLRVGAVVAGAKTINVIQKALDSIAICASQPGQAAALYGLKNLADWQTEKRLKMERRLAPFQGAMAPLADRFPIVSAGAFFAYCGHPFAVDSMTVGRRLADEASVAAMPGSAFGHGQESMIRFAWGNIAPERASDVGARLLALA
jgi:aspartate/methionine/tyrosine aminotransferase